MLFQRGGFKSLDRGGFKFSSSARWSIFLNEPLGKDTSLTARVDRLLEGLLETWRERADDGAPVS
jgi:hypothetical protein